MSTPPPADPAATPAVPSAPPPPDSATPAAAPAAYQAPPIEDDFVAAREHELTRRERLLLTALLPSALLLGGCNTVMVMLLTPLEYPVWGYQSLGCYGLAAFLLSLWFYVKWRYVWSVRKAHHLAFYLKRGIEITAALALLVMGAYLFGFKYYMTADITRDQKLSLSPKSVSILRELPAGSKVELFLPYDDAGLYRLSEMERVEQVRQRRALSRVCQEVVAEAPAHTTATIQFTTIKVNEAPKEAQALAAALQLPPAKPGGLPAMPSEALGNLFVAYTPPPPAAGKPAEPTRYYYIDRGKMYQRGKPTKGGQAQGNVFVGESRVLATIERLRINNPAQVYCVEDHSPRSRALPDANNFASAILRTNNLQRVPLLLKTTATIPADADFVLLLNVEDPLTPAECDTLYRYMAGGGSMLVCIDPENETGRPSGLAPFLEKFGLVVRQDRVIQTTLNGEPQYPSVRGVPQDLYRNEELPPNFEWLRMFTSAAIPGQLAMRGACYLETPRAISDPALKEQHAKFYELLTTNRPSGYAGQLDIRATANTPGQQDGLAGPFTLGGVVQMYRPQPKEQPAATDATGRRVLGQYHHLFVIADSDWVFANDNMGNYSNQVFLDLMLQKLVGAETVEETNDPTLNFIHQDPHGGLVAFFTGILPAMILAIIGYMYLSARRQMPAEVERT